MQVVKTQPTGAFTQGGAGIGAVIFDKPQYNTLQVAMKVGDDLNAWAQKKAQENAAKKKALDDMTKDLDVSQKDFLPEGAEHMMAAKNELIDKQTNWLSIASAQGEQSPQAIQAYKEAQQAKNKLQIINNNLSEAAKAIKEFKVDPSNLEKVDMDDRLNKVANVRISAAKDPLGQDFFSALQNMQMAPQPPDINKAFGDYIKDVQTKKVKTVVEKNGILTESETEYKLQPPKKDSKGNIVDYGDFNPLTGAGAALSQTKAFQDAANPMFDRMAKAYAVQKNGGQLQPSEKDDAALFNYYTEKAAEQSKEFGQYVSPQTVYANEELMRRNLFGTSEEFKTETEARKEAGKQRAIGAKEKQQAANQMRWLIEIGRGSPNNYTPMVRPELLGGYNAEFYGTETLGGIKIGDRTIWNSESKKYETVPNFVKYFAIDPKTKQKLYASDESIQKYIDKKSNTPFVFYDNIGTIGSKMSFSQDGTMVQLGNYWSDIVKENKWNKDNNYINVDIDKVAPLSMYEQSKRTEESEKGAQTTPFAKTPRLDKTQPKQQVAQPQQEQPKKLEKTLSSGRKVYSDDGGKTWHP